MMTLLFASNSKSPYIKTVNGTYRKMVDKNIPHGADLSASNYINRITYKVA